MKINLAIAAILAVIAGGREITHAQLPDPYHAGVSWGNLPEGRKWGGVDGVAVDHNGNVWAFERCGGNEQDRSCATSNLAPILEFDPSGKFLKSFGAGMFALPHGLYIDKDDNVWATDERPQKGKGCQVFEFSPEGKLLLTMGKAGVCKIGPDTFESPMAVLRAPNGDIFVSDGNSESTKPRIMKFSKDGMFIKDWGKYGTGPGEFNTPHTLAMDSKGRIFVGDEHNYRIQIFDQDGDFLEQWKQFGRPEAIFIGANDMLYVSDILSQQEGNQGFLNGIRIGSAKNGSVKAFIPEPRTPDGKQGTRVVALAVDAMGNIYGGDGLMNLLKYVKKNSETGLTIPPEKAVP